MDWVSLLAIAIAFAVVTASPGPGNLASAAVSMSEGRKTGFVFAAGLASGLIFWGIIAALGMGAVLQTSAMLLLGLKIFGAVYLFWLSFQSFRSASRRTAISTNRNGRGRWYLRGLLLNLSNPKAVLAWLAAYSVGLGGEDDTAKLLVATGLCIAITVLNAATWAWLFSQPAAMTFYAGAHRGLSIAFGTVFALSGMKLLTAKLQ